MGNTGDAVLSCDYNGWADLPEEQREAIEAFEASYHPAPAAPAIIRVPPPPATRHPSRKAA